MSRTGGKAMPIEFTRSSLSQAPNNSYSVAIKAGSTPDNLPTCPKVLLLDASGDRIDIRLPDGYTARVNYSNFSVEIRNTATGVVKDKYKGSKDMAAMTNWAKTALGDQKTIHLLSVGGINRGERNLRQPGEDIPALKFLGCLLSVQPTAEKSENRAVIGFAEACAILDKAGFPGTIDHAAGDQYRYDGYGVWIYADVDNLLPFIGFGNNENYAGNNPNLDLEKILNDLRQLFPIKTNEELDASLGERFPDDHFFVAIRRNDAGTVCSIGVNHPEVASILKAIQDGRLKLKY
jgi:hypothetical protein